MPRLLAASLSESKVGSPVADRITAPSPERARALLELVEGFLLKPRRREQAQSIAARKRNGPRTRRAPHSTEHEFDMREFQPSHATPEEMRAWREALKGPNGR